MKKTMYVLAAKPLLPFSGAPTHFYEWNDGYLVEDLQSARLFDTGEKASLMLSRLQDDQSLCRYFDPADLIVAPVVVSADNVLIFSL